MHDFKEDVRKHFGILLTNEQMNQFETYYEKLIEYNKHTNLTRITIKDEVYYKHFYDSLTLTSFINKKDGKILDMGSGAGFPSIPLKIIFKDLKVTIVDSLNKRIVFLKELVKELNLKYVNLIHDRAENFSLKNKQKFDYVTARALGKLNLILEMGIPALKVNAKFLAMKGKDGFNELNESLNALKVLNSKVINQMELELPKNYGKRSIIVIEKQKHIKGYPRKYQNILKKPL